MSLADSPLKPFKVEVIEISWGNRTKALLITCPRCDHEGIVSLAWKNSSEYGTRPCTYCFKTAKIPPKKEWQ
jgi:transcription elongation factor Elf1